MGRKDAHLVKMTKKTLGQELIQAANEALDIEHGKKVERFPIKVKDLVVVQREEMDVTVGQVLHIDKGYGGTFVVKEVGSIWWFVLLADEILGYYLHPEGLWEPWTRDYGKMMKEIIGMDLRTEGVKLEKKTSGDA